MKIIKMIVGYIEEELEGAEDYAKKAILYKDEHPELARTFYEMSLQEMHHVDMMHAEVVKMIEKHRREKGDPPAMMLSIWEYHHERHIEEAKEIRILQAEYRSAGD